MPLSAAQQAALKARKKQAETVQETTVFADNSEHPQGEMNDVSYETVNETVYPPESETPETVHFEHVLPLQPQTTTPYDIVDNDTLRSLVDFEGEVEINRPSLVYGLDLNNPRYTQEQREAVVESVYSYIGVTPRKLSNYTGRWITVVGAVVAPITGNLPAIDKNTGQVTSIETTWDVPLFKLTSVDEETGMNTVIAGGGAAGKKFALTMVALFGPGDWKEPKQVFISQEERQGVNKDTGIPEPHRLFRFMWRRTSPKKA